MQQQGPAGGQTLGHQAAGVIQQTIPDTDHLVAESVQEVDDDFIKTAVPVEELEAALEDENFSEGTITTEGSEPDPDPSPLEEWVKHDHIEVIDFAEAFLQCPAPPGWAMEPPEANEEQVEWTDQDGDYNARSNCVYY